MTRFIFFSVVSFFFLYNLVFSAEDIVMPEEMISNLSRAGQPIQISVIWSRLDGKFEIINDFYLKDNTHPITKVELASKCQVKELLPFLIRTTSICPLKLTVTARTIETNDGMQEAVTDFIVMDEEELMYYGFIGSK